MPRAAPAAQPGTAAALGLSLPRGRAVCAGSLGLLGRRTDPKFTDCSAGQRWERGNQSRGEAAAQPHLAERMMTLASSSFASSSSAVTFLVPGSN